MHMTIRAPRTESATGIMLVIALILMVPLTLWSGFVFSTLWGWFVVPLGMFHLGTVHAAGLLALLSMLTVGFRSGEREFSEALSLAVLLPAFTLFLGWVLTLIGGF